MEKLLVLLFLFSFVLLFQKYMCPDIPICICSSFLYICPSTPIYICPFYVSLYSYLYLSYYFKKNCLFLLKFVPLFREKKLFLYSSFYLSHYFKKKYLPLYSFLYLSHSFKKYFPSISIYICPRNRNTYISEIVGHI